MYHIEDSHEPIIDKETFNLAQQIMNDRRNTKTGEDKNLSKYNKRYPLSGIVYCGKCGRTLKRRYWNYGTDVSKVMMQCGGYLEGKANCSAKAIESILIEKAAIEVINKYFLSNIDIINELYRSILSAVDVSETAFKIDEIANEIIDIENKMSSLAEMKLENQITKELYSIKFHELNNELHKKEILVKELNKEKDINFDKNQRVAKMKKALKEKNQIDTLEVDVLRSFIYRIITINKENIIFCVSANKAYSDKEFTEKIKEFMDYPSIFDGKIISDNKKKILKYKVISI